MKKTIMILLIAVVWSTFSMAQNSSDEVKLPLRFLTFRNSKLNMGLGGETNFYPGEESSTLIYFYTGKTKLDSVKHLGYGLNIGFDLFAPNSIVSLATDVNLMFNRARLYSQGSVQDWSYSNLDIPLYLKLRLGAVNSRHHVILQPGVSYSLRFGKVRVGSPENMREIDIETIRKSAINPAFLFGYEIGAGKVREAGQSHHDVSNIRAMVFLRTVIQNQTFFNNGYQKQQLFNGISNSNIDIKGVLLTFGLRVYFNLTKPKMDNSSGY